MGHRRGSHINRLLHVLLAAQYPLKMNPIMGMLYHTAMPHAPFTLCCAVHSPPPQKKNKFVSSLTGDINPQVPTGTMEKWKVPIILPTCRQKLLILPLPSKLLLSIFIFVLTFKKLSCRMPNIKLHNAHCRRVQSLSHGYATSTPQCHMCAIHYIALSDLPAPKKQKKFAPSLTGYIKPKSFH